MGPRRRARDSIGHGAAHQRSEQPAIAARRQGQIQTGLGRCARQRQPVGRRASHAHAPVRPPLQSVVKRPRGGDQGLALLDIGREIATAEDAQAAMDQKVAEYTERFANPYVAAARGYVDDIIDPRDTRPRLIDALETLQSKRDRNPPKKHGNLPL